MTYIGIGVPLDDNGSIPHTSDVRGQRAILAWTRTEGVQVLLEERLTASFDTMRPPKARLARETLGHDDSVTVIDEDSVPLELLPLQRLVGDRTYQMAFDDRAYTLATSFAKYMNQPL